MSIKINDEKCVGCKGCVEACPGNLIKIKEDGKAHIDRVRDCWGCTSCLKACHFDAIAFFLGADIGGRGGTLHYEEKRDHAYWRFKDQTITINKKESNQY